MADEDAEIEIKRALDVLQSMIDISADRLEGLRTQCATSAELTQQEIRTLEGKLIKLFSRQLVNKAKLSEDSLPTEMKNVPRIRQWLQVVGLSEDAVKGIMLKVSSLEALQEKSEHELRTILIERNAREEEVRRLIRALHNLRKYIEILLKGDANNESNDLKLYWDSWDRHRGNISTSSTSPRPVSSRATRCSIPSEEALPYNNNNNYNNNHMINNMTGKIACAVSLTSINSTPTHHSSSISSNKGERSKYPTTPPPHKKHQTGVTPLVPALLSDLSLTKSRSHESQLGYSENNQIGNGESHDFVTRRGRLPTEPGPNCSSELDYTSPLISSPVKSPPYNSAGDSDDSSYKSLQVPKSPRTPTLPRPGVMGHVIAHRFTKTYKMMTTCDYCEKQMFIGTGLKCKECKYKCHRDCESKVPPSCRLPRELLDEFIQGFNSLLITLNFFFFFLLLQTINFFLYFEANNSPNLGRTSMPSPKHRVTARYGNRTRKPSYPQPSIPIPPFPGPDSSSTSSCNSSTPSSPALVLPTLTPQIHGKPQFLYPVVLDIIKYLQNNFKISDINHSERSITLETHPLATTPVLEELLDKYKSQDSDKTVSVSGSGSLSTDSERTPIRVDSQDSQVSDGEPDRGWPRQNSLSIREWDIPYEELQIGDSIGTGRFGTVYRGNWHGDVAIKVLNMDYLDDEKRLDAFKLEVATFRKTRHQNLVLFMGACMNPKSFAIVTSLSKGMTLYTHIHLRKDKFTMNKTSIIAQQISQGMGYLHARGIIHKDLKTKNIFLENGKVVITDFGLFGVTKLSFVFIILPTKGTENLIIPPGWLCYLSPEIMRSLKSSYQPDEEELPFSRASDIYAFGTVWYELLCGDWPFKGQLPEAIIWQVGKGMKQSLANLQASRDVKDILMMCWAYRATDRPDFTSLLKTLEKLPRKRLARSPSHPIHLSRSAESVF
ncbi:predicted protein [Pediculus humanus corporis]|uniref:Predicted protein n=1 Tax=Pediculus humanus subsp. corporis TaxID=121224 RepID=E0VLQ2_PEDHC|nr:uncharacterized protein Phum_PHUM291680 [Pediculus humanus corporis]EEB14308.1 predicted protein [Pediculus humanus corporis]